MPTGQPDPPASGARLARVSPCRLSRSAVHCLGGSAHGGETPRRPLWGSVLLQAGPGAEWVPGVVGRVLRAQQPHVRGEALRGRGSRGAYVTLGRSAQTLLCTLPGDNGTSSSLTQGPGQAGSRGRVVVASERRLVRTGRCSSAKRVSPGSPEPPGVRRDPPGVPRAPRVPRDPAGVRRAPPRCPQSPPGFPETPPGSAEPPPGVPRVPAGMRVPPVPPLWRGRGGETGCQAPVTVLPVPNTRWEASVQERSAPLPAARLGF